jgi:hypothetical protein
LTRPAPEKPDVVSLHAHPIVEATTLPDGRSAEVRVGIPDDDYVDERELDTIALEVRVDGEVAVALNTVLDADEEDEARELAREVAHGLRSGSLEPTAGAIEPLADELR